MKVYHYKNCSIVVNNISYIEKQDIQYTNGINHNILVYFCTGVVKQLHFPTKEEQDFEYQNLLSMIEKV